MELLKLFNYLEDQGVTPNQLYLLYCIQTKRKPQHINTSLELRQAIGNELVIESSGLSDKGKQILEGFDTTVTVAKKNTINVDDYLKIFPKGKLPSGKPARVNAKTITESFVWFFKNYDFTWDVILDATKLYVDEYESKNYLYMKNSQYFIRKCNTDKTWDSELANYCELVQSGYTGDESNYFSENVV